MSAGPKRHTAQPYSRLLPPDGPERTIAFIEGLRTREGPVKLRNFQREIIEGLYSRPRPRQAYVQMPRQNGKSQLAAWLGLYAMVADNAKNPVVALVANSERQASEILKKAVEVYDSTPELEDSLVLFSDRLEYRAGGTRLQVFASSPAGAMGGGGRQIRGLSCHLVFNDELAFTPDPRLWSNVLLPTTLADPEGLALALTTPGWDQQGPAFNLYRMAQAGTGERFYSRIYAADADCALDDEDEWKRANPALGDGLTIEALKIAYANRSSDEMFRREHLGLWTATAEQWIKREQWDACANYSRSIERGERVWIGFDGSWSRDSTALVACTEDGHVEVLGLWEANREGWTVPREEVHEAVHRAFTEYRVEQMLCDPSYWETELQEWASRYGEKRVLSFPPTRNRMGPASTAFHGAVMERRLSHAGDERLTRHVLNAVTKPSPFGDYLSKANKDSPLKIDAAVAAVVAFHAAMSSPRKRTPHIY